MNIIIIGDTSSTNFGDPILTYSTQYIYQKVSDEYNGNNKCVVFDIVGRPKKEVSERLKASQSNLKPLSTRKSLKNVAKVYMKDIIYISKWLRYGRKEFENRFVNEVSCKPDVIIIAGGALISSAVIYALRISTLVRYAEKNNISVVFNSVGVERSVTTITKFIFRKLLRKQTVVAFSTRDNVDVVRTLTRRTEFYQQTPDPGIFASETYKTCRVENSDIVGIGVISYAAYQSVARNEPRAYDLSENDLLNFWASIISELDQRSIKWKVFTNGGKADYQEALKLMKHIGVEPKGHLCEIPSTPSDLVKDIASFKMIVAHRLHAFIIGTSLQIPVIPIVWSNKVAAFAEMMGTSSYWPSKDSADKIANFIISNYDCRINQDIANSLKSQLIDRVLVNLKMCNAV